MQIGIDASWAVNESAGVGRYSYELLGHLPEVMKNNDRLELFATYLSGLQTKNTRLQSLASKEVRVQHAWVPGRFKEWCFRQTRFDPLPLFFDSNIELYHAHAIQAFPLYVGSASGKMRSWPGKAKKILTLHDLSYFHFPEHLGKTALRFQELTRRAVRLADRIICDSKATLEDAVRYAAAPKARCLVIQLGLDELFAKPPASRLIARVRRQYRLPKEFFLFVGTIEPRKNVAKLIEAHSSLSREQRQKYPLLIAGRLGWKYDDVLREISNLKYQMSNTVGQTVRFLGFIPDEELPALYKLATVFVYPSLLEGFGLPPLEAMAQGTPVITSDTSSLPEVVGPAGLLVNPMKVEELERAMVKLLTEPKLRRKLRFLGRQRAKQFTWRKTVKATYQVYRETLLS